MRRRGPSPGTFRRIDHNGKRRSCSATLWHRECRITLQLCIAMTEHRARSRTQSGGEQVEVVNSGDDLAAGEEFLERSAIFERAVVHDPLPEVDAAVVCGRVR